MKQSYFRFLSESGRLRLVIILTVSILMSLSLEFLRIRLSGNVTYIFLIWNLFLASIPAVISSLLSWKNINPKRPLFWLLASCWLLFFPNSPYIITDIIHFRQDSEIPGWFDVLLLVSFAWNGLMLGLISLREMQVLVARGRYHMLSWFFVILSLGLGGFGIYLGRVLRWNSWDIVTHPFSLFASIFQRLAHPLHHSRTWAMSIMFAAFMLLVYLVMHQFSNMRFRGSGKRASHDDN